MSSFVKQPSVSASQSLEAFRPSRSCARLSDSPHRQPAARYCFTSRSRSPFHHRFLALQTHNLGRKLQRPSDLRQVACQAGEDEEKGPPQPNKLSEQDSELFIQGSDTSFLVKLLVISIGGAAVVKYGSLVLDAPFQPDAGLGLTLVLGPCLVYSIALLYKSREESL